MKKILLISNHVFHYRQKIYNYFNEQFKKDGFEFQVLSNSYQKLDYEMMFPHFETDFSNRKLLFSDIDKIRPDFVILFLHLKDRIIFPLISYCKKNGIPVIFWNIGINSKTPNNFLKNLIFHRIHDLCDALITYTPETKKYFSKKNYDKLFVAYNTLFFNDIDKESVPSREDTKKKYGIKQDNIILFISRMMPYKRVDLLMDSFESIEDIAVVMVGPGFSDEQKERVKANDNFYYLGEKYGNEVNEIYKMGDIFSTPGHIGLAMTEALFWNKPVVLLDGFHAPEIYYMKNNVTGYLAKNDADFKEYIINLFKNKERLEELTRNCQEVFEKEVSIENMYRGFIEAIQYCANRK